MSNIDQDFVEFIVKSLVGKPDQVQIERRIDEKGVLIELTVDPEDLGRIIGKRGATAQSLRTLLRALGTKNDARYNLKIIDNGPEDYKPNRNDRPAQEEKAVEKDNTDENSELDKKPEDNNSDADNTEDNQVTNSNDEASKDDDSEVVTEQEEPAEESDSDSRAARTRRELEDLDDLDI